MRKRIQYATPEERTAIAEENSSLILVEEQLISEGNFLVFSDQANIPIEIRLQNIEDTLDIILLKQEGIL